MNMALLKKQKYRFLRKKYPIFVYERYAWKIFKNNLEIVFDFQIDPDINFQPKIIIENIDEERINKIGESVMNNLVFHLGLIELLSYWKATCSPEIKIEAGYLDKGQIKWWKDLIINGMGQFFYENKIDFTKPNFLRITPEKMNLPRTVLRELFLIKLKNRVLAPLGGGKDSIITLETLKGVKGAKLLLKELSSFSLNPTETAIKIIKIAGCKNPIIVLRTMDEKLLGLNRQGFLNGHTPFSAYVAFLSVLLCVIFDRKYIALSNERSSNEGNVSYLGKIVNHQYSKSFDFEKKFRDYSKKYLARDAEYFSFLRPLYEIQIAKIFSRYPKYFNAFLSCNEAYKTVSGTKKPAQKWCGNCSKCLFVFAILYPFLQKKELIKIFKQNLFEKKELLPIMLELLGEKRFKPFECVGTKKECLIAFYLSWKKDSGERVSVNLPFLLEYFQNKVLPKCPNPERNSKQMINDWDKQHRLPGDFEKILKKLIL